MKIINLTQHKATPDQIAAGVVDIDTPMAERLGRLLTVHPNSLLMIGQTLLTDLAAHILNEFVLPEQIKQCEKLLADEYDAGACGLSGYHKGIDAENLVHGALIVHVMVGGFPPLVDEIKRQAKTRHILCHDALSTRDSVDEPQPDGTVRKVNVFKHVGFWPPVE